MPNDKMITGCCICGGGPAGIMLGFLLARAGIEVIVLENMQIFFATSVVIPSILLPYN
jgi:2-polyprenyl-6-methoxyphenol hydroxylase-like FAD-dependent oxidoreductase